MKQVMSKMHGLALILALLIGLIGLVGCDGSSDIINPPDKHSYTMTGLFVQNMNSTPDNNYLAVSLTRDGNPLNSAQLFYGTSALTFDTAAMVSDSFYTFGSSPRAWRDAGSYDINIVDSTLFTDAVSTTVVDSFRVTNYNPDSLVTYNSNNTNVLIEWTSAANIEGYVIAATPADSLFTGYGYSAFVTTQSSSASIPRDAFRSPIDSSVIVTGTYHLLVYGYTGSPDSTLASEMLPVPFPGQLPENVSQGDLTGRVGTVTVIRRVPLEVTSQ